MDKRFSIIIYKKDADIFCLEHGLTNMDIMDDTDYGDIDDIDDMDDMDDIISNFTNFSVDEKKLVWNSDKLTINDIYKERNSDRVIIVLKNSKGYIIRAYLNECNLSDTFNIDTNDKIEVEYYVEKEGYDILYVNKC